MKEIVHAREINEEKNQLKNISEQIGANTENLSLPQADEKLAARLEIGATDNLDKKTAALKKEINEVLAEKYNTSPEFEELRSKKKINRLSNFEKA